MHTCPVSYQNSVYIFTCGSYLFVFIVTTFRSQLNTTAGLLITGCCKLLHNVQESSATASRLMISSTGSNYIV